MKKNTLYWIGLSDYDIETAADMLKSQRYVYVVFMCHISVEKMLKACVCEFTDLEMPPKIHNLPRLAEIVGMLAEMSAEQERFLRRLTNEQTPTRYPQDLLSLTSIYTRQFAESVFASAKEMRTWLRQRLPSDAP